MITACKSTDRSGLESAPAAHHILFLFDQLLNLNGGAERTLVKIIQLLPADRYRASIVTFCERPDTDLLSHFDCPVHFLPLTKTYGLESIAVARQLHRLIQEEHVSIVQTFFETSDLWGGFVAKMSGCPILISSRRDMGFKRTTKHRIAYRLLSPLYDQVQTVSDAVRDYTIREDGISPDKVITIPNGVEMQKMPKRIDTAYLRRHYGLENASHVILDVGSVKPVKGYEVLARTAQTVCRQHPEAVFVIVGSTPDEGYLAELKGVIEKLGMTRNFRFIGHSENVYLLLQMCDVFCHLSLTDGLSNAVLEAMATGLPCVISRVGGNPEVVEEGRSGFVVPPGDHVLAAQRVLTLLASASTRQTMGDRGRQIIEQNYTAEEMVRKLVTLYDGLVDSKAALRRTRT